MDPSHVLEMPDGRRLGFDDIGARDGRPIIYLHGTPDSRLARHPDDSIAEKTGVRLIAVDRPGAGGSDLAPGRTLSDLGDDLAHLADALGLDAIGLLGWSSGGLAALAAATRLEDRLHGVTLVGPVPPIEAYAAPGLVESLGPSRRPFVELALTMNRSELAAEMAQYMVPDPLSPGLALEHVLESAGALGRSELESVPGAAEQMARALADAVASGTAGLAQDVERQLEPGLDLALVRAPVLTVHGALDPVSPPSVGEWLCDRLPRAAMEVVDGAGHHLLFPLWRALVVAARDAAVSL